MVRKKNILFLASLLLLFFFSASLNSQMVVGLGASPARATLKYEPGGVYEGAVCYSVSGFTWLRIEAVGEFPDNVEFLNLDESMEFEGSQSCLEYRFTIPKNITTPGIHRTIIMAAEIPPETESMLVAVVRIGSQIDVVVPYPGKYLEVNGFYPQHVGAGEKVPFQLDVLNRGNETVERAKGTVYIYDNQMNQLDRFTIRDMREIEPDKLRTIYFDWDSGENKQGNYKAKIVLDYDEGMQTNGTANFKLGGLEINLINYTSEVIVGNIRPFYAIVDSIWSEVITGVRANISMYNSSQEEPLLTFETLSKDIPAWGTQALKGYIDVTNISLGNYTLKIDLIYADQVKHYEKPFKVVPEPPAPSKKKKAGLFGSSIIIKVALGLLAILLIAMIILLISLFLPKKKKEQKEQQLKK